MYIDEGKDELARTKVRMQGDDVCVVVHPSIDNKNNNVNNNKNNNDVK